MASPIRSGGTNTPAVFGSILCCPYGRRAACEIVLILRYPAMSVSIARYFIHINVAFAVQRSDQLIHLRKRGRDKLCLLFPRIGAVDDPNFEPERRQFMLGQRLIPDEPLIRGCLLDCNRRKRGVLLQNIRGQFVDRFRYRFTKSGPALLPMLAINTPRCGLCSRSIKMLIWPRP